MILADRDKLDIVDLFFYLADVYISHEFLLLLHNPYTIFISTLIIFMVFREVNAMTQPRDVIM